MRNIKTRRFLWSQFQRIGDLLDHNSQIIDFSQYDKHNCRKVDNFVEIRLLVIFNTGFSTKI